MPRRLKEGLDYFPVDTKIFSDPKIVRLMYDHGPDAVMIYFMFLSKVYDNGYFLECDLEKLAYLISYEIRFKETNKDLNYVYQILLDFVKLDIIDEASLSEGIITSKGIQKQFLASTQRRKQRERKHWILTPEDEESVYKTYGSSAKTLSGINVNNNSVQGELMSTEIPLNGINVDNNISQEELMPTEVHKVKVKVKDKVKVKGKEDKGDQDDKYDKGGLPFEAHYFLCCLLHDHLLDIYTPKIDELNELFISAEQSYTKEHCFWIFKYVRARVVDNKKNIISIPDYFMTAYKENLKQMEGYYERMEEFFKSWELTLEEFVKVVRGSKARIPHLEEKLEWTIHLIYAIPGPVYGEVIRGSNVHEDKLVVLLDKKDKIEKKIKFLIECEEILHKFLSFLTEKEKNVFHLRYFKDMSQNQIGIEMFISQQAVSQYIDKINKKWKNWT